MTYTRSRIWLGSLNVGFWLLASGLGLLFGFPEAYTQFLAPLPGLAQWAVFVLIYVLLSFPFDWIGGHRLPYAHGRSQDSFGRWLGKWARGAGIHAAILWLTGIMLWGASLWLGILGGLGWMAIMMLLLTGFQLFLAQGMATLPETIESNRGRWIFYVESEDRGFTGGVYGVPGKENIILPQYWKRKFDKKVNSALLARRHGAIITGSHGRGIGSAVLVNLALLGIALWLSPDGAASISGLVRTSLTYTLLFGLALVGPFPWLSRRGVFEVDRWSYHKGVDGDALRESFQVTDRLREDPSRDVPLIGKWLVSVPDEKMRLQNLQTQKPKKGAWQATRHAVFTSWAGVNLLSRAMHYHIGRPDLWVFLPGD